MTVRPGPWAGPRVADGRTSGGIELHLDDATGSAIARPALLGLTNAYNVAASIAAAGAVGRDLVSSAERDRRVRRSVWAARATRDRRAAPDPDPGQEPGQPGRDRPPRDRCSLPTSSCWPSTTSRRTAATCRGSGMRRSPIWWPVGMSWSPGLEPLTSGSVSSTTGIGTAAHHPRSRDRARSRPAWRQALARTPRGGTLLAAATYTAMMGLRVLAQRQGDAQPAPR